MIITWKDVDGIRKEIGKYVENLHHTGEIESLQRVLDAHDGNVADARDEMHEQGDNFAALFFAIMEEHAKNKDG